jgi:hypothetical protein
VPYILKVFRKDIDNNWRDPQNSGELNYAITKLVLEYYEQEGGYSSINDVLGALEGAKLEFYRRVAAPYEDTKIEENGDVY